MFGAWFIDVILVQYFIAWKIIKGKSERWIALSFFISMIAALVFIECEFNARWYNGLMFCTLFLRIRLCSKIMLYMGKRSLYFYLIHTNLLLIIGSVEGVQGIHTFYMVLILTFLIVVESVNIK